MSRTTIVGDLILGKGWHTASDIAELIKSTRQQAASAMNGLDYSSTYKIEKNRINKKAMIRVIAKKEPKKECKVTSSILLNSVIFGTPKGVDCG